jgi:hypothetical protein
LRATVVRRPSGETLVRRALRTGLWVGRALRTGLRVGSGLADGAVVRVGLAEGDVGDGRALRRDCGGAVPGCVIVLVAAACVKGAFGVAGAIFDP